MHPTTPAAKQWLETLAAKLIGLCEGRTCDEVVTIIDDIADSLLIRAQASDLQELWPAMKPKIMAQSSLACMAMDAAVAAAVRGVQMVSMLEGGAVRRSASDHFDTLCGAIVVETNRAPAACDAYWISDRAQGLLTELRKRATDEELLALWSAGVTAENYRDWSPKSWSVINAAMRLLVSERETDK